MKILLPDGEQITLDENIGIEEKIEEARKLVVKWEDAIVQGWGNNNIKYFLDSLSNYIVWHKEDREAGKRGKEDKEILSRKKLEKMNKHKKTSKTILFSDLEDTKFGSLVGESRGACE